MPASTCARPPEPGWGASSALPFALGICRVLSPDPSKCPLNAIWGPIQPIYGRSGNRGVIVVSISLSDEGVSDDAQRVWEFW